MTRGIRRIATKKGAEGRRWDSASDWARDQAAVILNPVARSLGQLGVHPNTVTLLGLVLQIGVGLLFSLGYVRWAGWLLLAVAPMDALDGAVAREVGQKSRFGAFLDSTLDRLSDAALILGLTAHHLRQDARLEVALLLVALVAAQMVSYARARAEALGFRCKVGLLTRLERVILIGALAAAGLPTALAWMLAGLSVVTLGQRVLHVYLCSRRGDGNGCPGTGEQT